MCSDARIFIAKNLYKSQKALDERPKCIFRRRYRPCLGTYYMESCRRQNSSMCYRIRVLKNTNRSKRTILIIDGVLGRVYNIYCRVIEKCARKILRHVYLVFFFFFKQIFFVDIFAPAPCTSVLSALRTRNKHRKSISTCIKRYGHTSGVDSSVRNVIQ